MLLAVLHLHLGGVASHAGGVVVGSDDEDVVLEGHEETVEAAYDGGDVGGDADDGVAGGFEGDGRHCEGVVAVAGWRDDDGVAVTRVGQYARHHWPRADVAPAEGAFAHRHRLLLEEHAVEGLAGGGGVAQSYEGALVVEALHDDVGVGEAWDDFVFEGTHLCHVPEVDTRVPQEFAAAYEGGSVLHGRFLGEGLHHIVGGREFVALLDVSVGRIGFAGGYADGEEGVVGSHEVEGTEEFLFEGGLVRYELVGRCDEHVGVGVTACDVPRSPHGSGSRREAHGFEQQLFVGEHGELFACHVCVVLRRAHIDVAGLDESADAVVGQLQE